MRRGFTLLEVLMASVILGFGLMAILMSMMTAQEVMPIDFSRSINSLILQAPSSRLYSVWRWRCANIMYPFFSGSRQ